MKATITTLAQHLGQQAAELGILATDAHSFKAMPAKQKDSGNLPLKQRGDLKPWPVDDYTHG
jgi:hypothetical protein